MNTGGFSLPPLRARLEDVRGEASVAPHAPRRAPKSPAVRLSLSGTIDTHRGRRLTAAIRAASDCDLILEVDSEGGDLSAARDLYDALRTHGRFVDVEIVGQALSAAAFVTMAGDRRRIAPDGQMMLHEPRYVDQCGHTIGRPRAVAVHTRIMSALIAQRTGIDADVVQALCEDETWFTAVDAVRWGLCQSLFLPRRRPG